MKIINKRLAICRMIDYICNMNSLILHSKDNRAYARLCVLDYALKVTPAMSRGSLFLCGFVGILYTIGRTIWALKTDERYSLLRISQREQAMSHPDNLKNGIPLNWYKTLCILTGLSRITGYGLDLR